MTSFDGSEFFTRRGLGHVADNFASAASVAELPGNMAAGHVRYSTAGGASMRNIQPLYADLASGGFAVAHNGNISNARKLRQELVEKGAIFQSTSDTEVVEKAPRMLGLTLTDFEAARRETFTWYRFFFTIPDS